METEMSLPSKHMMLSPRMNQGVHREVSPAFILFDSDKNSSIGNRHLANASAVQSMRFDDANEYLPVASINDSFG
jgi:hypothetical protein